MSPRVRVKDSRAVRALLWIAVLAAILQAPARPAIAAGGEPEVAASLSPGEIEVGQAARLTVTVSGVQSAAQPQLPSIDGIEAQGTGQQMSVSIVNGAMSAQVSFGYLLRATRPGDFAIPSLRLEIAGRSLATQPLTLHVRPAGAPPSQAAPAPHQPSQAGDLARANPPSATENASLELLLPRRDLYVGEVVSGTLRLLVRESLRVLEVTQPTITGQSFTINRRNDREPEQTTTTIDGVAYHVVTFPIAVSPISAGEHSIDAHIEMRAIVPRARPRARADGFDDPFFDSFFDGAVGEPRKLDVVARPKQIRVLPLPEEGRPADFSGAIGRFSVAATAEPTRVTAGDPVTVRVTVSGEGNLDRVALAPPEPETGWKLYPESSRVESSDGLGLRGKKVFEQAIVPERSDKTTIPTRHLSFFDPEARRYVSLATQPVALAVAPAPGSAAGTRVASAGGKAAGAGSSAGSSTGSSADYELAPNEIALGRLQAHFAPIATRPWFLALQIVPLAGLAAGLAWVRRSERRRGDPGVQRARAARQAIAAHLSEMTRAERAGDRAAFFSAARHAVQERAAARDGRPGGSLTLAEVEAALASDRDASTGDRRRDPMADVRALFAEADATSYGGASAPPSDLGEWRKRVERLLRELERSA